ncbi:MAG: cobalt-precorrin 5A hydrolase [Methanoregulaceae archaeon]|nr:cobalt-precorrin 5A hydrolase [Methanoregulaceae archaeon]
MSDTAVVSLHRFSDQAERIAGAIGADRIEYRQGIFSDLFPKYRKIVAVMSVGIAVRGIAPLLSDKWRDPAVVVVSPDLRYAVPILGGHHGANALARDLAGVGSHPVITTATEAFDLPSVEGIAGTSGLEILNRDSTRAVNAGILDGDLRVIPVSGPSIVIAGPGVSFLVRPGEYTVGIGCRKGIGAGKVVGAVTTVLADADIQKDQVLVYATTGRKLPERGLHEAVRTLEGNLVFLDDRTIRAQRVTGPSAAGRIGLPGVAEPCALAVSRLQELVVPKRVIGGVTVAVAR